MRILHVTDCYLPRIGGIEVHVRDLAHHQRLDGHEVTIATRTPTTRQDVVDDVLRVRSLSRTDLATLAPDVVHAHLSILSPMTLAAVERASTAGLPTVVTVHSLWSDLARIGPTIRAATGIHRWPVTWTAVSEAAAHHVHSLTGRPVAVVPNAVEADYWRAARHEPPHEGVPVVLSVMRLTTVKRTLPLARILRTVAERTSLDAVVVGDGPKRRTLEAYLRRHDLTTRVRVAGALDRDAVRREMADASIFLAPARRESFGIAALEARTAGLPVIAFADSGVASFIEHERDGLLARDDREFADYTTDLIRDEMLRGRISRHNRAVVPEHTWPAAAANNARAYAAATSAVAAGPDGGLDHGLVAVVGQ